LTVLSVDEIFSRFDAVPVSDIRFMAGQTDWQTDRHRAIAYTVLCTCVAR